jgi:hypothetical protein
MPGIVEPLDNPVLLSLIDPIPLHRLRWQTKDTNSKKIQLPRVHPAHRSIDGICSTGGEPPAPDLDLVVVVVGEVLVELLKGKPGQDVLHDRRRLDDADIIAVADPSPDQVPGISLVPVPGDDAVEVQPAVVTELKPPGEKICTKPERVSFACPGLNTFFCHRVTPVYCGA